MTDHDSPTQSGDLDVATDVPTSAIPAQRAPGGATSAPRYAEAPIDLRDPRVLVRSWMATLHGPTLDPRPRTTGHLPSVRELLPTVLWWHVAYAVLGLAGALVVQRSGSGSLVADELAGAGRPGLLIASLMIWWGGVAVATVLWWAGVVSARTR